MPSQGLVPITTASFTTASSFSIDNCFTTDYDYYRIHISGLGSTSNALLIRMRAGGVDTSSGIYDYCRVYATPSAVGGSRAVSANQWSVACHFDTNEMSGGETWISYPASTSNTQFYTEYPYAIGSNIEYYSWAGDLRDSVSYDGITFITNTGTVSGNIWIWGLAK
jgi:hypothetical protein